MRRDACPRHTAGRRRPLGGERAERLQSAPVPRLPPLVRLGLAVRRGFGRFTPDPFVVAVAMTVVTLVAGALALGGGLSDLVKVVRMWSALDVRQTPLKPSRLPLRNRLWL